VEETHLAGAKKKSLKERRTLVLVDESGLSERPSVVRTWARKGQTPQLVFSHAWGKLSVIAGITWWEFYFRLFRGSIKSPQAVEFLGHLRRQIRGRLLIIWDGLAVHRSRKVRDYVERSGGQIVLARLPAYAPELNPSEYIWGHLKRHALANFCPKDIPHLSREARRQLRRSQRRTPLIRAFWQQAELFCDRMLPIYTSLNRLSLGHCLAPRRRH
jgi:transposase